MGLSSDASFPHCAPVRERTPPCERLTTSGGGYPTPCTGGEFFKEDGMFERFKNGDGDRGGGRGVATEERGGARASGAENVRERELDHSHRDHDRRDRELDHGHRERPAGAAAVRAHQREEFGGINWGAAFFGWLVAVGVAVILTAIASAAGAAFGLSDGSAKTVGLVSGIVLLVILGLAYYAGGYVAGRMSRFDGARQGLGVWILGLVITIIAAVAGAILGSEYNIFSQLNLPNIPIDSGTLTTGGIIALLAALAVTVLAAIFGGKVGERYHRKIDRYALD